MKAIDPTLSLNTQAWAVLHAFSYYDLPKCCFTSTAAWYNGRERGFSLAIRGANPAAGVLYIVVAEARSSDGIIVESWTGDSLTNPPTINDRPEYAYDGRRTFQWLDMQSVCQWLESLIETYLHK